MNKKLNLWRCWIIRLGEVLTLKEPWLPFMDNFIPKLKPGILVDNNLKMANLMLENQMVWDTVKVRE